MNIRPVSCKAPLTGKLCEITSCPVCARARSLFRVKSLLKSEEFSGTSPSVFVGHVGYPYLNVGILSPPERTDQAWEYDAPSHWASNDYGTSKIIELRTALVNSRFKAPVRGSTKFLEMTQEIGMAAKPVDVEITLSKIPRFSWFTDSVAKPMGPNATLKQATMTENPKIPTAIEKVVDDSGLKASEAITSLYRHGFDENQLAKLLSVGTIGLPHNRRIVPTRWSTTATDDILGDYLREEIKQFPLTDYRAFFGSYLGNNFLILCYPEIYSYELFEMFAQPVNPHEPAFTTDAEPFEGRSTYAENTAGGFYAARLAIMEGLKKMKRQSAVIALRFITGEYEVPLGVFVVREAARRAMHAKPLEFSSEVLMATYAEHLARKRFGIELSAILRRSKVLDQRKHQPKLSSFVGGCS